MKTENEDIRVEDQETAEATDNETPKDEAAEANEETTDATEEAAPEENKEEDEDLQTKYMRLMADFQNFKRRAEKQRLDTISFANEKIIAKLLEVMDNFERALDHDTDENFKEGMVLIFQQLQGLLKEFGVEEINTDHADFDPNFHNAVMMEDTDEVESGKVSATLQKGYTLHGKVVRPAMVKVAN